MQVLKAVLLGWLAASCAGAPVLAHSWYDPWCCNDKDCARIPPGAVRHAQGGVQITLKPGEHPSVTEATVYFVASNVIRRSRDGDYHACILPGAPKEMRCFYESFSGS